MQIQVSSNFKKMTVKAIFAIVLFILVYLILLTLAIGLTIVCTIGGIALFINLPALIALGLGLGLASLGFFILIFLFKFVFKKHKIDRSHLTEITQSEEPKLFQFIEEIVKEADTDFPKKVYISSDVNASVFYDSGFWSMFLPIRKNLQIGLGLVNSITTQEFKAILAHEFGHFSQRSMKVGSYVYNVNQVIFNMLYENESFANMVQRWANISGYFSAFLFIAIEIIKGIQWVLRKMYDIVNLSYMALSREMEFHADEVAANIAGYEPLKDSLLRMNLADYSFNAVLNFYNNKISENLKSKNIFREHSFVMNFLAKDSNLEFKNNLPVVTVQDLNKYNKSKLNIKDQWASHPSTEERIAELEKLQIVKQTNDESPAISLFYSAENIEELITEHLFSHVVFQEKAEEIGFDKFQLEFIESFNKNSFPKAYNGYYDNKNPTQFDIENIKDFEHNETIETLFNNEKVDMIYDFIAFENDKNILTNISNKNISIKTFDYDGKKYKSKEAKNLITKLEKEVARLKERIEENDINIYKFFCSKSLLSDRLNELKNKYIYFFKYDSDYEKKVELYNNLINSTHFISVQTPFEQIRNNFIDILKYETQLKNEVKELLSSKVLEKEITKTMSDNFKKYISEDLYYFNNDAYNNDNLQILFTTINDFYILMSRNYFLSKLDLLNYQIKLLENKAI